MTANLRRDVYEKLDELSRVLCMSKINVMALAIDRLYRHDRLVAKKRTEQNGDGHA